MSQVDIGIMYPRQILRSCILGRYWDPVSQVDIGIAILSFPFPFYQSFFFRISRFLTNLEQPRTESEYERSYGFKLFVFQFINYYSSLTYTAFFKGRFFTYPGDQSARESSLSLLKTDICDPSGMISNSKLFLILLKI